MAEDQHKSKPAEAVEEEPIQDVRTEGEKNVAAEANGNAARDSAAPADESSVEEPSVTEGDESNTPEAVTEEAPEVAAKAAPKIAADETADASAEAAPGAVAGEADPEEAPMTDPEAAPVTDKQAAPVTATSEIPEAEADVEPEAVAGETPEALSEETLLEEAAAPTSVEGAASLQPTGRVGFTGEIVGRVVKLEDLEEADRAQTETSRDYDQLMRLVDDSFTIVSEQEIVRGRVVSVGEKDVVIDIGFKSDGVVSLNEFGRELSPGDEVEVLIDRLEDSHGQLVLSKTKADKLRRWERIENAYNNEEVLDGVIVRRIKGGMIAELFDGMEAFLPGSQIDVRPVRDFDAYLGSKMEFKIVKLNPANENIVVSHKALIEKELQAQRESILSTMEPGQILEGTVKNITDFGVFIDLGGVDGLLHITDLSWGRVSHPSELVDLDQQLNIVVLDYDKERQRISLGLKQLQPHPWDEINVKYAEGQVVEGKVVSITDYGAFVELEKGIEGLVHISEMSWTEHIRHPSQMVSLGQLVNVKILNIDKEGKKISLGMKQLEPDPWEGIALRYPPGTVLRGKVRNITNFGVFVEIEPGIDGLVHISDLSWTKKIRHPSEMIKKGQELDVVILNVDEESRRISLGHKQVETNPWNQFAKVYAEDTDTEAKVVRSNEGGLVVELPLEVEAFVPASELKNGPQHFQDHYRPGQEIELRVIKFDPNQKEIVLSEVAKVRAEEHQERVEEDRERRQRRDSERREVRDFKKSADASGPTTLGELSGLADLKAQIREAEKHAETQASQKREGVETDAAKADAAPEASAATEPEVEATEAKAEAVTEPEVEAATEAKVEAATEPEAEAATEPEAKAAIEPETEATAEAVTEPEAEVATEPEAEVATEAEAEPVTEPEDEAATEAKPEAVTEPEEEAATEPDAEVATADEPEAPAKGKSAPDVEDEVKSTPKAGAEKAEPAAEEKTTASDDEPEEPGATEAAEPKKSRATKGKKSA